VMTWLTSPQTSASAVDIVGPSHIARGLRPQGRGPDAPTSLEESR
jgi:hypothetical protein